VAPDDVAVGGEPHDARAVERRPDDELVVAEERDPPS
jgi:hypothetical protein